MKNSGDKIIQQQVDNLQVSFDKEAAWMRLQDRLESKDEKKGNFRIGWIAAAVSLIATALWYSLSGDTEQPVVKNIINKEQPATARKEQTQDITLPVISSEKQTILSHAKKDKQQTETHEQIITPVIVQETAPEPIVVQQVIQPANEVPKPTVAQKPKIRVIHINELIEEERQEYKNVQERAAMQNRFVENNKNLLLKPSVEREDATGTYPLFGNIKTTQKHF